MIVSNVLKLKNTLAHQSLPRVAVRKCASARVGSKDQTPEKGELFKMACAYDLDLLVRRFPAKRERGSELSSEIRKCALEKSEKVKGEWGRAILSKIPFRCSLD